MENPLADIDRIAALADPVERAIEIGRVLNELQSITVELRVLRQAAVNELRQQGWSLSRIGQAVSLHPNRIQQIAEGRAGGGAGGTRPTTDTPDP